MSHCLLVILFDWSLGNLVNRDIQHGLKGA